MCMYCKCKTTIPSFTTHVVNYKNCIIIIKMCLVKNVNNVERSIIQMKLQSSLKALSTSLNSLCRKLLLLIIQRLHNYNTVTGRGIIEMPLPVVLLLLCVF